MATEKRLIYLDEALEATHKEVFWTESEQAAVRSFLVKQPKVDAVEVVHGRWIEHSHLEVGGECSVCGWQFQWFENDEAHYCPHCGAKMDGGNNDEPATSN